MLYRDTPKPHMCIDVRLISLLTKVMIESNYVACIEYD